MPNQELIAEWIDTYGVDSDFVRTRVRRLPAAADELQFIDRSRIKANMRAYMWDKMKDWLLHSAIEKDEKMAMEARLPQNIESTVSPPPRPPSENRTFLPCWE
jgi:hypothetical protein